MDYNLTLWLVYFFDTHFILSERFMTLIPSPVRGSPDRQSVVHVFNCTVVYVSATKVFCCLPSRDQRWVRQGKIWEQFRKDAIDIKKPITQLKCASWLRETWTCVDSNCPLVHAPASSSGTRGTILAEGCISRHCRSQGHERSTPCLQKKVTKRVFALPQVVSLPQTGSNTPASH